MERSQIRLPEYMGVLKIVPEEIQELISNFFDLWQKTRRNMSLQRWQREYGDVTKPLREGPEATLFESEPVIQLIQYTQSVRDFPEWLLKHLRYLGYKRDEPLTVLEFAEVIKDAYHDAEKLPPTRKMMKVFRSLLGNDPFTSRRKLANHLAMSEDAIRWHIAQIRRRFALWRLIDVNYYKLGLSSIWFFTSGFKNNNGAIHRIKDHEEYEPSIEGTMKRKVPSPTSEASNSNGQEKVKPIPGKYLYRTERFPTNIANQYISLQIHTPPWYRRYDFYNECKNQVDEAGVSFIPEEPDIYYATGRKLFYYLKAYDFKTGQWNINLRDLRFRVKNRLMIGSEGVSPLYDFEYGVERQKDKQEEIEFDELDLQICEGFYKLEGMKKVQNRSASAHAVSQELGVSPSVVAQRMKRLREEKAAYFFYWTSLGLPAALSTLLISKDEFILNSFQSVLAELPVSSVVTLESLRDKTKKGIFSHTYFPRGLALMNLVQTEFLDDERVAGFCIQGKPLQRSSRALEAYRNPKRKNWKWKNITT